MLDPKCIYRKSIFAKCTRLACLLSFASLFKQERYKKCLHSDVGPMIENRASFSKSFKQDVQMAENPA